MIGIYSTELFRFNVSFVPYPENDRFDDGIAVQNWFGSFQSSMLNTTVDETDPDFGGSGPTRSVWWSWTAQGSGQSRVSVRADEDVEVWVYLGTGLDELVAVAGGSDNLLFYAQAGLTYQIAVVDSETVPNEFTLSISGEPGWPMMRVSDRTLGVTGEPGQVYRLFRSVDLKEWTDLGVNALRSDFQELNPPQSGEEGVSEFYRVEPLKSDREAPANEGAMP